MVVLLLIIVICLNPADFGLLLSLSFTCPSCTTFRKIASCEAFLPALSCAYFRTILSHEDLVNKLYCEAFLTVLSCEVFLTTVCFGPSWDSFLAVPSCKDAFLEVPSCKDAFLVLLPSLDGFLALLAAFLLLGPSTSFSWLEISPTLHLPWVSEEPDSSRPFSLVQHGQGMKPSCKLSGKLSGKLSLKLS